MCFDVPRRDTKAVQPHQRRTVTPMIVAVTCGGRDASPLPDPPAAASVIMIRRSGRVTDCHRSGFGLRAASITALNHTVSEQIQRSATMLVTEVGRHVNAERAVVRHHRSYLHRDPQD